LDVFELQLEQAEPAQLANCVVSSEKGFLAVSWMRSWLDWQHIPISKEGGVRKVRSSFAGIKVTAS